MDSFCTTGVAFEDVDNFISADTTMHSIASVKLHNYFGLSRAEEDVSKVLTNKLLLELKVVVVIAN